MASAPSPSVRHRHEWRDLVGLVHPASGRTLFQLATSASIPLFEAELAAFAHAVGVTPAKQIVLVLDRAGWHSAQRLRVPDHVHLHFLPPYCPELQPAERLWPLTNTALANRHFATIDDLEDVRSVAVLPSKPAAISCARPRCSIGGHSASESDNY
jgi:transposase